MADNSPHLEDSEEIRMLFQRLCREGKSAKIRFGNFQQEFPLLAEQEDRIVLGISGLVRGQWGLKPGVKLTLSLDDRGRPYEAVVEFGGHGTLKGDECGHILHPRMLKCMDESRLADFRPEPPIRCSYTTKNLEIRDGFARALGFEGLELVLENSRKAAQDAPIRMGTNTTLELALDRTTRLVMPGKFSHLTDAFAGVRFLKEGDQSFLLPYRAWLEEALRSQRKRDLQVFDPKGVQARIQDEEKRPGSQVRILSDHDPMILVICEGEGFAERMSQALGRRFGISFLDYVQGEVRPRLGGSDDWGRYKLILAHQRLRVSSGLELTRQLVQDEKCPLPILVAGTEEDVSLKRNRAIAAGAVDFISVDPFNVLKVMKSIADTLAMFG